MKICTVVSTYPRSDTDTAVPWLREDIRRLKERGHDVTVYAPAFKGSRSHVIDGIPVHRFRYFFAGKEDLTHDAGAPTKIRRPDYLAITAFYILFGTIGLYGLHRKERFDLLHVHWPFPHGLFGIVAQRARRVPLALSFHGAELLLARKFAFVDPVLKVFTRRADLVTCNSSYTADAIRKLGTCEPVILPYGSPIPSRATALPEAGPVRNILYVGRLIERKGVEHLIDAMPLVLKRMPAKLTIIGNGNLLEPLRRRAASLGLQESIEFRVDVPEADLVKAYERCEVFVLPAVVDSRGDTEGLGVVLIEALSFGRPVVASEVGGIVDVIIHRRTGLLTPQKDPKAIADALIEVLSDRALAQDLADNGLKHVASVFDWDRIIDRTETLYRSVSTQDRDDFGAKSIDANNARG